MAMRIAVLGTGHMGRALIKGLVERYGPQADILAWDSSEPTRALVAAPAVVASPDTWFAGETPAAVIVAVKPADVAAAVAPLAGAARSHDTVLWCSVAAGVKIAALERALGEGSRICRVMPNTPALIGEGISAFALNNRCSPRDAELAAGIFGACGKVVHVPEKFMNAVTGLSGSGPAYVYLFIESLIEGGVGAGLPYDVARQLAVQTVIGAGRMVERTGEPPAALKAAVMSPGGTTARGLLALEQHQFKFAVMKAVSDAARRAEELGG
jgi:pyrroline-5-carboxylate reductase